jgi:hypothetical protein
MNRQRVSGNHNSVIGNLRNPEDTVSRYAWIEVMDL